MMGTSFEFPVSTFLVVTPAVVVASHRQDMERRVFIIGAVGGAIGLVEYAFVNGWMNKMSARHRLSVKGFEQYGQQALKVTVV